MFDNFSLDITSDRASHLVEALIIAFTDRKAVGYREDPDFGLVLCWTDGGDMTRFPFPLDEVAAMPILTGWLEAQEYPREPDIDGSCKKGWRLYNNAPAWSWRWFVAIKPAWAIYHK